MSFVVLGSGALAREMIAWIRMDPSGPESIAYCFDPYTELTEVAGVPVHKEPKDLSGRKFLIGLGNPSWREQMASLALKNGAIPGKYIHSTAVVSERVAIGDGVFVGPRVTLSCDVTIGNYVHLNVAVGIGHDVCVGDYTVLLGSNAVNGNVSIGSLTTVGAGSVIHPGRHIGDSSTIGIGSVVIRNVRAGASVFGNPAKVL